MEVAVAEVSKHPGVITPTGPGKDMIQVAPTSAADVAKAIFEGAVTGREVTVLEPEKPVETPEAPPTTPAEATPAAPAADTPPEEKADLHPLEALITGGPDQRVEIPEEVVSWHKAQGHDITALLNEAPTLRTTNETLAREKEELTKTLSYLEKLSPDALNVIQMELAGKDWKSDVQSRPNFDYRLTFEKQDPRKLADTYAAGKITADDWASYNSEEPDPGVKRLVDTVLAGEVKLKYEQHRDQVLNYSKNEREQQQAFNTKLQASEDRALDHVLSKVPGAAAHKDQIKKSLQNVSDLFYEADGTWKPDAAFNAWMIVNKDILLRSKTQKAATQAKDEAQVTLLQRKEELATNKPIRGGAGAGKEPESAAQVVQAIIDQALGKR